MAVLYNGKAEKYLVEDKYAIAIWPGLQVFAPQPLQHKLKVFVGGIGEPPNIDGKSFFLGSAVVNFPTNAPHKVVLEFCTKYLIILAEKLVVWGELMILNFSISASNLVIACCRPQVLDWWFLAAIARCLSRSSISSLVGISCSKDTQKNFL